MSTAPATTLFEHVQAQAPISPFLASALTLERVSQSLTGLLRRHDLEGTILAGWPAGFPWPNGLQHYQAAAAQAQVHLYTAEPFPAGLSHPNLLVYPLADRVESLGATWFLFILTPTTCLMVLAQEMSSPDITDQTPQLLACYSSEPTTITIALEALRDLLAAQEPEYAAPWATLPDLAMPSPLATEHLVTALIQGLDESVSHGELLEQRLATLPELQQVNQDLQASLHFKDEFMTNVAHQLRTPLTNIKTAVELLRSPRIREAQKTRYWEVVTSECEHQVNLISSLLELTAAEQEQTQAIEAVTLFDMVPGVVSTYQAIAQERGILLAYTIPINLPPVQFPQGDLKQVLVKLINNAINFTPDNGKIWLTASANGSFVQLEVKDTGLGIPTESLPKIFDRFYRVPRARLELAGAGLGLSIVQKLLLRSGGAITVRSQLGQGSIFTVILPTTAP